jgi:hypothetical protein
MKVEVFFEVSADEPDLAMSVLEMLNKGASKQWGKKNVRVGTPAVGDVLPPGTVVIAPFSIRAVP